MGNREWGLRPQTPPPTEMSMVAHNGTTAEVLGRLRIASLPPPRHALRWAGGLGVRAQAPFACHKVCGPITALMSRCLLANRLGRERGPENGHPDRLPGQRFSEHLNCHQPRGLERDDLALAGGVVCVLRPTLAGAYLWRVEVAPSTPCLAGHSVGNRKWGLRPQTPPPTERSMVAHNGTAVEVLGRLGIAWLFPPYQTRCWAGGLGVRAQAPFALATAADRLPRC